MSLERKTFSFEKEFTLYIQKSIRGHKFKGTLMQIWKSPYFFVFI